MSDLTPEQFLEQRQRAYKLCFGSPAGKEVLKDLATFCRANATAFDPDPRIHAALEGRREVWLRICEHFDMTLDDLVRRYNPVLAIRQAENA